MDNSFVISKSCGRTNEPPVIREEQGFTRREVAEQALATSHQDADAFGTEHPDTLNARHELACWTGEAGDAAGARDQYLRPGGQEGQCQLAAVLAGPACRAGLARRGGRGGAGDCITRSLRSRPSTSTGRSANRIDRRVTS